MRLRTSDPYLVSVDLDGTLVEGTTACLHVAAALGCSEIVVSLVRAFDAGEISNRRFIDGFIGIVAGRQVDDVRRALVGIPTIHGVAETLARLRADGAKVLINTITWRLAAELISIDWAVDRCTGWEMERRGIGRLGNRCARYFDPADKASEISAACIDWSIPLARTVHVGDSRGDAAAFRRAGFAIALNPSDEAATAADLVFHDVSDFAVVGDAIRTWAEPIDSA